MHLSYLQTCDLLKQVKYPQNVLSPIRMCQPLSRAVTIFVTILSLVLHFASFVNPWRLAISHTEIFTLVILHVSKSECKHKSQACFVTALLEHKRWLPQDFQQMQLLMSDMVGSSELFSSASKIISPYFSTPNRQINYALSFNGLKLIICTRLASPNRRVQRLFCHHFSFFPFLFSIYLLIRRVIEELLNSSSADSYSQPIKTKYTFFCRTIDWIVPRH